jgi:hypothetical protein
MPATGGLEAANGPIVVGSASYRDSSSISSHVQVFNTVSGDGRADSVTESLARGDWLLFVDGPDFLLISGDVLVLGCLDVCRTRASVLFGLRRSLVR